MKKIIPVMLMITLMAGFPFTKATAQLPKPVVQYVQNLELAKIILRPQHKELLVTRDPFNPIIAPAPKLNSFDRRSGAATKGQLDDVLVLGIVKLDQDYRAYIKFGDKTRVVSVQDTVGKYTITDINMDQVVFRSGNKEFIKKRGKL
jgi:hypothetical protein